MPIRTSVTEDRSNPEVLTIQYLRGVAAIVVVIFHIGQIFNHQYSFGATGVDIFFVISGFIMWMVSRKREVTPLIFIKKRLLRIVPLYWLIILIMVAGSLLRPNLFPQDHPTVKHVLLSIVFIPHFAPNGDIFPMVGQGWTLDFEMFFYLLFAISIAYFRKHQFYMLNAILLGSVVFGYFIPLHSPMGRVYTSPLLLEFLAGIYICQAWLNDKVLGTKFALLAIIFAVLGIIAVHSLGSPFPRFINYGIPAVLIVFGAVSLESKNTFPKIRLLKLLGDASYSIYLTHYLSWLVVSIILAKLSIGLNDATYLLTIFAAIIGGVLTYMYIEKPLSKFLSTKFIRLT